MSRKLRIGIIGATGRMAGGRAKHWTENPKSELVAVSSRREDKAKELGAKYKAKVYTDWEELLKNADIDAVSISTPNYTHYEMIRRSLEQGKHVMVEYPLATDLREYDELVSLANAKKLTLHHSLTVRNDGYYIVMRENLEKLGKMLCADVKFFAGYGFFGEWVVQKEMYGDIFASMHIHWIDQYLDLFGEVAWLDATKSEIEEENQKIHSGTLLLKFKSGLVGYIQSGTGFGSNKPGIHATILGSKGYLEYTGGEKVKGTVLGKAIEIDVPDIDTIRIDSDNFVEEVLDGVPPLSPLNSGRETLEVCLIASRSAAENKKLFL